MEERVPQIVQLKLRLFLICETTYKLIGVFGITITKISEIIVITISPTLKLFHTSSAWGHFTDGF